MMHTPRKRFGQHFLHDKQIIQRLVETIHPQPGQHIVEIGPGQGAITLPILKIVECMDAIELDWDLVPALKLRCSGKGVLTVHQADALEFDFSQLLRGVDSDSLRIVGNLPYNISTPLIFHLLEYAECIDDMHFMLQKEVTERLAAKAGDEAYGRLSIMVQYHCEVFSLFRVPPGAFYPPPQIDSAIVKLVPYHTIPHRAENYSHFADLVRHAFSHRRKTLRNSLKEFVTDEDWKQVAIDPQLRPEQLNVADYVSLSNHVYLRNR
jgi:16S rRNA (adenine1518-N6/adenine1519-N6)-dimethyltransferase